MDSDTPECISSKGSYSGTTPVNETHRSWLKFAFKGNFPFNTTLIRAVEDGEEMYTITTVETESCGNRTVVVRKPYMSASSFQLLNYLRPSTHVVLGAFAISSSTRKDGSRSSC
jgi:hypothetical protein